HCHYGLSTVQSRQATQVVNQLVWGCWHGAGSGVTGAGRQGVRTLFERSLGSLEKGPDTFSFSSTLFPCNTGRSALCIQLGSDHEIYSYHPRQPAPSPA